MILEYIKALPPVKTGYSYHPVHFTFNLTLDVCVNGPDFNFFNPTSLPICISEKRASQPSPNYSCLLSSFYNTPPICHFPIFNPSSITTICLPLLSCFIQLLLIILITFDTPFFKLFSYSILPVIS
ncbi:hypothetical protein L1887_02530 [Cichorium endivia]|nr:hypothetical protein L1887_02530 [Cichorium endivia]